MEVERLKRELSMHKYEYDSLENEKVNLKEELSGVKLSKSEVQDELRRVKRELEKLQREAGVKGRELDAWEKEKTLLQEEIKSSRVERFNLNEENRDLMREIERLKSQLMSKEGVADEVGQVKKEKDQIYYEYTIIKEKYTRIEIEKQTLIQEKQSLEFDLGDYKTKLQRYLSFYTTDFDFPI